MTLTYALTGSGRELLSISGHRARYLILQAAHPGWRDRAGLYTAELPRSLTAQVARVTAEVLAGPVRPRGRGGPVLTAADRGRRATTALEGPAEPAGVLLSEVIELARESPARVVTLAAEVINGTDVRLAFTAAGSQGIDLQLRRESCRVSVLADGGWRPVWSPDAGGAARLTLVAPPDGFVDGVRSPALLAAGTVAWTVLPAALSSAPSRRDQVLVEIDATLELSGTEDLADADPGISTDLRGRWPVQLAATIS